MLESCARIHRPVAGEWETERNHVDLVRVATRLLGPAQARRGDKSSRSWWRCPFHPDQNPSFCVRKSGKTWACFGCGLSGDAVDLVRRLDSTLKFKDAVDVVLGKKPPQKQLDPAQVRVNVNVQPKPLPLANHTTGLRSDEAATVAHDAAERLWLEDSAEPGRRELARRGISPRVAAFAYVGWIDRLPLPLADGRIMNLQGCLSLPWFNQEGLLAGIKIRRMDDRQPKYLEIHRNPSYWTGIYPTPAWVEPGLPVVIVEGELDALCLGSCLAGLASVVTLGSASRQITFTVLQCLLPATAWIVATDNDPTGLKAAQAWPASARRIHPPYPFKDWCQFYASGRDIRQWWREKI